MKRMFDTKERIARSNIYSIFGKLMNELIDNNDVGEVVLKKAGLSSYIKEHKNRLCPYYYNGEYQNKNEQYNPEYACMSICEKIESNEEALLGFFNAILENTHKIDEEQYKNLSNYLNVIGYELLETVEYNGYNYCLIPSSEGVQQRNSDMVYLRDMLKIHHSDLVNLYDEAISNFGLGQYTSCIENCRSLFESFFKKLDTISNNYVNGILKATNESIIENGTEIKSKEKIYKYWLKNQKGANRFRLFHTMYSVMSGLGTHHEDVASKEDALLLLRYMEDCLLWCFRKGINC